MDLRIDALTVADWPEVRRIYEEGLATGVASFETTCPSCEEWDKARLPHSRLVARRGRIVGWAALGPFSSRACYAGVAEVAIYVAAAERGRGVGRRLLEALIEEAERHGIWTLQGVTFAENAGSLALQARCGFRMVGRRERIAMRAGRWYDTILTERRTGTGAGPATTAVSSGRPQTTGTPAVEPSAGDRMDEKTLFTTFWTNESKTTRNVLARIPEGSGYRPDPRSRTAREIAWQIVREERMIIEALETGKAEWAPPPMPATMQEVLEAYEQQSAGMTARWMALPAERWDGTLEFFGSQRPAFDDGLELPLRHRAPPGPDHDILAADGIDRAADLRAERGRAVVARPVARKGGVR